MENGVRQWRPSAAMRLCGVFIAAMGGFFGILLVYLGVTGKPAIPVSTTVVGVAGAAMFAALGVGYAVRYEVAIENGELVVTGLWRTQRVPVQKVVRGRATKSGISFAIDDGRRILARAVETASSSLWTQQSTRAYDVIDEVMAAAEVARASHPATAPDAALIRRNVTRRRNLSYIYLVFSLLVVSAAFYIELHS